MKVLDAMEEKQLAQRARTGSRQALERLVLSQRSLVQSVARQYARSGNSRADLESEGWLGVLDAAERFDPERNIRFSTYARYYVRAYVLAYMRRTRTIVGSPKLRVARRMRAGGGRLQREIEQREGRPATDEEIAASLGEDVDSVRLVRSILGATHISLRHEDPEGRGYVPLDEDPSPEEHAADKELRMKAESMTHQALAELGDRERSIVEARWFAGAEGPSLRTLGRRLGISGERVRQIEARAFRKMRRFLETRGHVAQLAS